MNDLDRVADSVTKEFFPDCEIVRSSSTGGVQRHPNNTVGRLFRVVDPDSIDIGHCWMKGRLKKGDLIICLAHSGDCFQDYILIEEYGNGIEGIPGSEWGSYGYGDSVDVGIDLTKKQIATLAEGEFVELDMEGLKP